MTFDKSSKFYRFTATFCQKSMDGTRLDNRIQKINI